MYIPQNAGNMHPKMTVNIYQGKLLGELSYKFHLLNLKRTGPKERNSPGFT